MYTSIIILSYNNVEYTKLCIDSVRTYTKNLKYEIIVVDNNSTDGTVDWLKGQKDIRVIYNSKNEGFSVGCNQGIQIAKGDNVLLLNNDTVVTPNWLNNMINALYSSPGIGAVGAITNNCIYHQAIPVSYNSIEEMQQVAVKNNISDSSKWEERLKLVAFCMLIKKEVINKVGLFDEQFTPALYEDADYSVRMRRAGYRLLLCRDVFIHHFGFASFKDQAEYDGLLKVNSDKFEKKWGYNPGYSTNIRHEIVDLIDSQQREPIRVLEIGCACGGTLLYIKQKYPNAELYGIELNENAAKDGSSFAQIIAANIEETALPYPENYFDYIILADVLEHLQNPWKALERLQQYLMPGGNLLASIPNIMHVSIIRKLLSGFWTYEDSGILDQTHLRFFTLHEIEKMFRGAGFKDLNFTARQIAGEADKKFIDALPLENRAIADQFTVFQYIVKAKKEGAAEEISKLVTDLGKLHNVTENIKRLNDYDINEIKKCINSLAIDRSRLYNNIAVANYSAGNYEFVIPYLQEALNIDSNDTDALYNMAYVLYAVKEYEQSLFFINKIANKEEAVLELLDKVLTGQASC